MVCIWISHVFPFSLPGYSPGSYIAFHGHVSSSNLSYQFLTLLSFVILTLFIVIEVPLIYNIVLVSGIQPSDSIIHICMYTSVFFFSILFHYTLLQDIDYSSLCYAVNPCCLYIVMCIC